MLNEISVEAVQRLIARHRKDLPLLWDSLSAWFLKEYLKCLDVWHASSSLQAHFRLMCPAEDWRNAQPDDFVPQRPSGCRRAAEN